MLFSLVSAWASLQSTHSLTPPFLRIEHHRSFPSFGPSDLLDFFSFNTLNFYYLRLSELISSLPLTRLFGLGNFLPADFPQLSLKLNIGEAN